MKKSRVVGIVVPSSIKHQTSSDCTGGHEVMQFDTASQNKH